jgi:type IV fimbrial biogenesis protein FimT
MRGKGFTLIELMVTLSITAILLGVGLPSFSEFIRSQAVKTASFDIHSTLVFARSEAIKRNADVTVTPVSEDWTKGWAVTAEVDGATSTLATQAPLPSGVTVDGPETGLTYQNSGRLEGNTVAAFEIGGSGSTRCINVTLSGLPNSRKGGC